MVLISLSKFLQLVRFSEQRPQNSDEVGYYSVAQPFTDESNQYDETPMVPPEDSPGHDDEYPSDDCYKRSAQNEPSHVKGSHIKKRNATFENAKNQEDKIQILAHDSLDQKKGSDEDTRVNRKIRMSDFKKVFLRSFKRRSFIDDNAEIYKDRFERGLISGDERFPNDIFRIRRSAGDEKKTVKSGDSSNAVLPTLSIQQLDKNTEMNASISTPDTGTTVHLPLEDVLSLIKVKRSAYDNEGLDDTSISSSENGEEIFSILSQEEMADLDVAESSVIFKPLFRYRSQIGQRRRVYNNY